MLLDKFIGKQLGKPSGLIGSWIAAPLWNRRNVALNDLALKYLVLTSQDRVLEVGFGGGYLLNRMNQIVIAGCLAGVDVSPAMVAFCTKRHRELIEQRRLELKCAPAEQLPFASNYFTKACSVNSIFYWHNLEHALAEFGRVLIQGGSLVLCFTCKESLSNRRFARHELTLYEPEEVRQKMHSLGFVEAQIIHSSDRHRNFVCLVAKRGLNQETTI